MESGPADQCKTKKNAYNTLCKSYSGTSDLIRYKTLGKQKILISAILSCNLYRILLSSNLLKRQIDFGMVVYKVHSRIIMYSQKVIMRIYIENMRFIQLVTSLLVCVYFVNVK